MKKIIVFFLTLVIVTISCQNKKEVYKTSTIEKYSDSFFQTSIDSSQIAGGAILVFKKDTILLNKSYGYASLELSAPMPTDGVFEIGSVTKQFTAAAILKLAEAQKLSLEDDFTNYISFDTKGRKITINNLLNHTSGIPSYTEIEEFWDLSIKQQPRDSLVRLIERNDFLFEPNEALIYNNSAYFFLGLIIEKITKQSFEEFLKQEFFEPLGMKNTSYCSTSKVVKNKVYGYNYSSKGLQQKPYLNHTWPYSAGSLCSTTEDLLIWMKALHSQSILSDTLYQSLITPDKLNDGNVVRYAKGLVNFSNFGHKEIAHGGGINGFLSETRYFPDEDLYIICLINTTGPKGAGFFADKITWKLLKKKVLKSVELDINIKKLEGRYSGITRRGIETVEIKSTTKGFTIKKDGSDKIDSLNTYIGNNKWMYGNDIITIKNNKYHIDRIHSYYILNKEITKG